MKIKKNQFACNFLHHQLWPAPTKQWECYRFFFFFLFSIANLLRWRLFRHTVWSSSALNFLAVWHGNSRGVPAGAAALRRFLWRRWWWTKTHSHMSHPHLTCSERTYGVLSHVGKRMLIHQSKMCAYGKPWEAFLSTGMFRLFQACQRVETRMQHYNQFGKKKKKSTGMSPKTKSKSEKEREQQQSERQLSTNSANYTGMDSFITQLTGCSLIASICSSLGLCAIALIQSSQSCCLRSSLNVSVHYENRWSHMLK